MLDLLDDPALPFFIQWQSDPALHPAATADGARPRASTGWRSAATRAKVGELAR